jgi:arylsulfatase A-like enzyme
LSWVFKHAGYTTALIGKWHLGGRDARPFGFEKSIVWGGTNNHRKSVYNIDGGPTVQWKGQSNATAMTTQALDWIDEVRDDGKPFFLVLSLNPPHGPFGDALEEKQALYPDESTLPFHPLDELRNFKDHRNYHALISNIDDEVGRVMVRLDELGLSDNTLLIYTSDHGGMTGISRVGYGQKRHPNDESTRVPFLARWPGRVPAGIERQTLFSTIDVFPTLAGAVRLQEQLEYVKTPEARASLAYLKSFPVDTIKIDQSFVHDLLIDPDDASITEAIISIAEKLRLRVVAEGVELVKQRDFLAARGCHEMQGFLFSHAVPGDDFLELLAAGPILR